MDLGTDMVRDQANYPLAIGGGHTLAGIFQAAGDRAPWRGVGLVT
jgi:hypothetical protein